MAARSNARLYREAIGATAIGLAVNLLLAVGKLLGGWLGGSIALLSDAVNSLGDVFTSAVVLCALKVAQKPADDEHPYGHTKAEAIAASNVALLVILSALAVGWQAVRRIGRAHAAPPEWALWLAAANVLIKEGLYQYKIRVGRRTGSAAVIANAWDHRNDALCSLAVLIGLGLLRWGGPRYVGADEIAALIVAGFVVWAGIKLFRAAASELMDVQADEELVGAVRQTAAAVSSVKGVEKLWLRKSGLEYFADIHIEVDPDLSVAAGHKIGHVVKDRLLAQFPQLRDVLVHLEPFPHDGTGGA